MANETQKLTTTTLSLKTATKSSILVQQFQEREKMSQVESLQPSKLQEGLHHLRFMETKRARRTSLRTLLRVLKTKGSEKKSSKSFRRDKQTLLR